MQRLFLALALGAAASPAPAQNVIGENPVLAGSTTCGAFSAMDSIGQLQALSAIEPLGDTLAGADPALARQWAGEVTAACRDQPDLRLEDAARAVLGGN